METEEPEETPKEVKDEPTESMEEEPASGTIETAVEDDDEADLEDKVVPPDPDTLEEPSGLVEPDESAAVDAQMEENAMYQH